MNDEDSLAIDPEDDERRHRGGDRRKRTIPVAVERRSGKDRRQERLESEDGEDRPEKGERRRQVDPTTCEKDYSDEEIIFMKAMDQYKRSNRRPFPTWSEVLEVLRSLGYRKVEAAVALPGLPEVKTPADEEADVHLAAPFVAQRVGSGAGCHGDAGYKYRQHGNALRGLRHVWLLQGFHHASCGICRLVGPLRG